MRSTRTPVGGLVGGLANADGRALQAAALRWHQSHRSSPPADPPGQSIGDDPQFRAVRRPVAPAIPYLDARHWRRRRHRFRRDRRLLNASCRRPHAAESRQYQRVGAPRNPVERQPSGPAKFPATAEFLMISVLIRGDCASPAPPADQASPIVYHQDGKEYLHFTAAGQAGGHQRSYLIIPFTHPVMMTR